MATPAAPLVRPTSAEAIDAVKASGGVRRVPAPLTWHPGRHLQSRFAFGPGPVTPTGSTDQWFESQLTRAARSPGYTAIPALATLYPYLGLSAAQTRAQLRNTGNEYGWDSMSQLDRATISLQAWSPCQLLETVVDFFSNKLNVANFSDGVWANRVSYDRDVIRANALGKYRDMLLAAIKHPAMLTYLNNDVSTWEHPNENLGRELLELHTVGIGAGYTQDDVVNSARILTGRSVDYRYSEYQWSQGAHWNGAVQVLGFKHANNSPAKGESVGDKYVAYLATHPSTAAKLARQLCTRYVSDAPSQPLVDAVSQAYLANDTAIVPMLRTIFTSTEFWDSRGAKYRRPLENLVATVRALSLQPDDQAQGLVTAAGTLSWMSSTVGQRALAWQPPNGYPDVAAAWRSSGTLLSTWSKHLSLASNWTDGMVDSTTTTFYGDAAPATVGAAVDAVATRLLGAPLTGTARTAVLTYLGEAETLPLTSSKLAWELTNVAAIVLHSPGHAYR